MRTLCVGWALFPADQIKHAGLLESNRHVLVQQQGCSASGIIIREQESGDLLVSGCVTAGIVPDPEILSALAPIFPASNRTFGTDSRIRQATGPLTQFPAASLLAQATNAAQIQKARFPRAHTLFTSFSS